MHQCGCTRNISRVAIVTGANKGLGFAIVKALCKEYDGKVYLTSRDVVKGVKATGELQKLGLNPKYRQLDVSDEKSVDSFIKYIAEQKEVVEILVNNAGILFSKDCKEPKAYKAHQTLHVNFFSLVNFTEKIVPLLMEGASIVNISSSSGHLSRIPSEALRKKFNSELTLEGLKHMMKSYVEAVRYGKDIAEGWGESEYVVSKVGVNAYTFMLDEKLKYKGIVVNSVHPGYVISDMTHGAGNVTPEAAAELPTKQALRPITGGQYFWHNGNTVPWDGPDPRGYIDGIKNIKK